MFVPFAKGIKENSNEQKKISKSPLVKKGNGYPNLH